MKEHHKEQFQGIYIPARIWFLKTNGVINAEEMLLLCTIHSLAGFRSEDGEIKTKRCFASNGWFAKRLGCSIPTIQRMLQKLKSDKLKLVHVRFSGRKRYLKTCWTDDGAVKSEHIKTDMPDISKMICIDKEEEKENNTSYCSVASGRSLRSRSETRPRNEEEDDDCDANENHQTVSPRRFIGKKKETFNSFPVDHEMAKLLRSALAKRLKISTKVNLSKWVKEFAILRESVDDDVARIRKVLEWYCANIGKEYVPIVHCAMAFRKKFTKIEAQIAMRAKNVDAVEVGDVAAKIVKNVVDLRWDKSIDQLAGAVQVSLDNYTALRKKAKTVLAAAAVGSAVHASLKVFCDQLDSPAAFVEQWFRDVHKQVGNWKDWSGSLKNHIFNSEHKRFHAMARGWVSSWDRIKGLVS